MTVRIDPALTIAFNPVISPPSLQALEDRDFESVLKDRLGTSKPLELMMVQFLSHTLEMFMSRPGDTEDDFFIAPPFTLNSSAVLPPKNQPPFPQQVVISQTPNAEISTGKEDLHDLQAPRGQDQDYDGVIEDASRRYGVDPALIKAVIDVESGGNPKALSPAGAQGLMQLMPKTAAELGVVNSYDPVDNIMAGTRYLRQLLDRYWGDVRLALAAYNWGMGNLEKRPDAMPKETKNYIGKVENLYRRHLAASL